VRDGEVVGIEAPIEAEVNAGHTCVKGRYAWQFYNHPERLDSPMLRKNGKLEKVTWEEAYQKIAEKLTAIKEKFGPDAIAGISSSRCTNEENYLMQKFFRIVLGTNNIDGCARVCHAPTAYGMQKAFGTGAATNSIADLEHTDCIFVIGANPSNAHPVTGAKIKQQAMKGKTLIVVDPIKTELAKYATYHVQLRPGTNVAFLNLMAYYVVSEGLVDQSFIENRTSGYKAFADAILNININQLEAIVGVDKEIIRQVAIAYASAPNAMEFHGLGVTEHHQGSKTVMLLANLAMMTGNIGRKGVGMNPLRGQNNVQGAADMGVQPNQGAGYLDVTSPEVQAYYHDFYQTDHPSKVGLKIPEMFEASRSGDLKAMWIMGEDVLQTDPNTCQIEQAIGQLDFLIVQEIFMTETAAKADVVLPASSFFEKEGTFTNGERRVQRVNNVVDPRQGTKPDGQIVAEVMNAMGYQQPEYSAPEVLTEIAQVVPFFKGITWDRLGKNGLQWPVLKNGQDTKILHETEFKLGRGQLHFFDFSDSPEIVANSEKFPYILTTGRILQHYNCGTMTRRTPNKELVKEDVLLINPTDAQKHNLKTGDQVNLSSERGSICITVEISNNVREGVLFTTFHFPEVGINYITSSVHDSDSMTPEYKIVAVNLSPVS
jgi:formate dehydrogenase major subunit